ncbi:YihY/virulence factor BrkB family protein [Hydrogenophaga sp. T2]|uniref:YihY/virulence factor BrkB family protein n=1 Tax=Hydrogenophaga sp. T2 TaxID=3132823 RepID=UPI003CE8EE3B
MASSPSARSTLKALLIDTVQAWIDERASSMGAALAYYTVFSIAPLLLIVTSVVGLFFSEATARAEIVAQLSALVGEDSARTVNHLLESVNRPAASLLGTVIGVGTLLIGATTVLAELQHALDRIWHVPPQRAGSGVWSFMRVRLLALGLTLGVGFLLMVSLVLSAGLAAFGKWWAPWFGGWAAFVDGINFVLSLGFVTAVFAMIYKGMPRVRVAWRDVWLGAFVTALLFTVGKALIGIYIGRSGVASVFGAASSVVVLLLWVYYSAQVFLLGATFTRVYAQRMGRFVAPA